LTTTSAKRGISLHRRPFPFPPNKVPVLVPSSSSSSSSSPSSARARFWTVKIRSKGEPVNISRAGHDAFANSTAGMDPLTAAGLAAAAAATMETDQTASPLAALAKLRTQENPDEQSKTRVRY